ncbi:replication endonuclease [Chitinivorax sp. B]|uniref:replication endonuclease n=1 Tax=Chitinivorax sp. B TaxID=2502235 RepID=UPI001485AE1E|nr:replication endonuclease [Chitinivorax sp. B]
MLDLPHPRDTNPVPDAPGLSEARDMWDVYWVKLLRKRALADLPSDFQDVLAQQAIDHFLAGNWQAGVTLYREVGVALDRLSDHLCAAFGRQVYLLDFFAEAITADIHADMMAGAWEAALAGFAAQGTLRAQLEQDALQIVADLDDHDLSHRATQLANFITEMTRRPWPSHASLMAAVKAVVLRMGATAPQVGRQGVTDDTLLKRLQDAKWWRRQLRVIHSRTQEAAAIRNGQVWRGAGLYVSDDAMQRVRQQKRRNRAMLEQTEAVNEAGDCYTLAELADVGVSNPQVRFAELMVRIRGFETIAKDVGHVGLFITISCPSRFHAVYRDSGKPNEKYDGSTPRDAQAYLTHLWGDIRAVLHQDGIKLYGLRVVEPHHDGCPHWHLLVFTPRAQQARTIDVFRHYALRDAPEEVAGREEIRCQAVEIDWQRGTAAGYVVKYLCKTLTGRKINGESIGDNFDGLDAPEAAERVQAWASVWGIRQFQQLGTAPVTVWRELRRLHARQLQQDEGSLQDALGQQAPRERLHQTFGDLRHAGTLMEAALAADASQWAAFVTILGGVDCPRQALAVQPLKDRDIINQYGEATGCRVIGVADAQTGQCITTRVHHWEIRRALPQASPTRAARCAAWTRVNNCNNHAERKTLQGLQRLYERRQRPVSATLAAQLQRIEERDYDHAYETAAIERLIAQHRPQTRPAGGGRHQAGGAAVARPPR